MRKTFNRSSITRDTILIDETDLNGSICSLCAQTAICLIEPENLLTRAHFGLI